MSYYPNTNHRVNQKTIVLRKNGDQAPKILYIALWKMMVPFFNTVVDNNLCRFLSTKVLTRTIIEIF